MVNSETLDELENQSLKKDLKKVEAILFISGRFLNMKELISFSDLNPIMIREILEKLKERYDNDDFSIQIVQKGERNSRVWKMDVKPEFSGIVNRLATGSSEFTRAEQETLAMIAYKQPIKQSVIIKIRGNKAYDDIKKFHELGLVKKKRQGHTFELSLSEEFYDYFNVSKEESGGQKNLKDKPNNSLSFDVPESSGEKGGE